jgi:tRNA(Ile)-lysidine synthase
MKVAIISVLSFFVFLHKKIMQDHFHEYLANRRLFNPANKIILAVSGGVDSMVMTDLFLSLPNPLIIAHCNFKLRGNESDAEEEFVRSYCDENDLYFYSKSFNTEAYAEENKLSVQMAARELRYDWFEKLRADTESDYIATAHNLDDQIETFFINLGRGTGIRGLTGIPEKSGVLIRPLINFSRNEILDYARESGLEWRDDSSNASVKYLRNKIRHEVLPVFRDLNPSFYKTMEENLSNLRKVQDLYIKHINTKRELILRRERETYKIDIEQLKNEEFLDSILYEILTDFNFNASTIHDILGSLYSSPGKQFYSSSHRLIKDREELIIEPRVSQHLDKYYIEEAQNDILEPLHLKLQTASAQDFQIPPYPDIACVDADKLIYPLILRKWHPGDYFQPLGMENSKKLSDFFVDNKFSIHQKENTWLLCSGQDIIWVVGHRIDNRYKINHKTRKILVIKIME